MFLNGFMYLVRDIERFKNENVEFKLMDPFLCKRRNVTRDNFFSYQKLAYSLLAEITIIVYNVTDKSYITEQYCLHLESYAQKS